MPTSVGSSSAMSNEPDPDFLLWVENAENNNNEVVQISDWEEKDGEYDPELLRQAFAEMVIEDDLPFAFGEKSGFKKFMSLACPRFNLPSRRTCTRDIVCSYFQEKAKLKHFLKENCQRVCLTTDYWTSQQQDRYIKVTAHFIDNDWNLHRKVISFFQVNGHNGDEIGKNLHKCLMEWGLDKVMTVTVDSASANDSGLSYLKKQMINANTTVVGGKFLHMRCAASIINLIVQDVLKEVDIFVKRVRDVVRYIKNETSRLVKFKEIAEEEKLASNALLNLDTCTQWNSMYLMLKAAIDYEKVFARYLDEDPYYAIDLDVTNKGLGHLDERDWDNAKKITDFLAYLYDFILCVSGGLHVTIDSLFFDIGAIHILLKNWMDSADPLQEEMGKRMKVKLDEYWRFWYEENDMSEKGKGKENAAENMNLLIFVGTVLDPRYKLSEYFMFAINEVFGEEIGRKIGAAVKACIHELYEEYRNIYTPSDATKKVSDSQQPKTPLASARRMQSRFMKRFMLINRASGNTKSELEMYLSGYIEDPDTNIDVLIWWKTNSRRFPILARLARDILAIPTSTVTSESAFSTSGRILDDFRTSLTPFMLQVLICTQDWLQKTSPINILENMEQLVELEKELIEEHSDKGKGKRKIDDSISLPVSQPIKFKKSLN